MERCPNCHRFGVDISGFYNPIIRHGEYHWPCVWRDCMEYFTIEEIKNAKHPDKFKKFRDSITKKESLV